ncbi:hypothetical protein B0H11DRAFT_2074364 [Mycena galericulata]|nr:hypothetical protein B0H11DRAFT_2074364 [Mycena galericulata]
MPQSISSSTMDNFPITEAQIVGLFLESVFWGFYLITFILCLRSLLFGSNWQLKRLSEINWAMLLVALAMCSFATLDVALGLMHNIEAFVLYTGPGGALEEFSNISDWVNIMKTVDVVLQTMLGDGMLIYRCWVVYGKSWRVVAFSILLWCGGAACTVITIRIEADLHSNVLITSSSLQPVTIAFWVLTIVQNMLTTGLLIFRIYKVDRQNARFAYHSTSSANQGPTRLGRVTRILLESGLMYTVVALITFVTFITDSNSAYGTSDVEVQVVGIAFNLIIIRADGRAEEERTTKSGGSTLRLQGLRRPMTSDPMDGVRVTVVNREFTDRDDKVDGIGKSSQIFDHTVSKV